MGVKLFVAAVAISVVTVGPPAFACHACLPGQPCLPCAGEPLDLRRGIVLVFTAVGDADATRWVLRSRPLRIQPLSLIPGVILRGRIACRGPFCVGRAGRFGGQLLWPGFRMGAVFRRGSRCEFVGAAAGAEPANRYSCVDAEGRTVSEGTFDVTIRPTRTPAG